LGCTGLGQRERRERGEREREREREQANGGLLILYVWNQIFPRTLKITFKKVVPRKEASRWAMQCGRSCKRPSPSETVPSAWEAVLGKRCS
jgi:hypothetical protein